MKGISIVKPPVLSAFKSRVSGSNEHVSRAGEQAAKDLFTIPGKALVACVLRQ
jgi:hypothetical protein